METDPGQPCLSRIARIFPQISRHNTVARHDRVNLCGSVEICRQSLILRCLVFPVRYSSHKRTVFTSNHPGNLTPSWSLESGNAYT